MDLGFFLRGGGGSGILIMKPKRKKPWEKNNLRTYTYGSLFIYVLIQYL